MPAGSGALPGGCAAIACRASIRATGALDRTTSVESALISRSRSSRWPISIGSRVIVSQAAARRCQRWAADRPSHTSYSAVGSHCGSASEVASSRPAA
ncbi:hypothetical protein [Fodinicola feengrottensis]|uniref:hypothetical protein n=1 Tax=Fodinicola feengrottensis TaxID=435914 RepID=UPI002441B4CA|nr:hypothetical protein [Fodinicola feengrottensis]